MRCALLADRHHGLGEGMRGLLAPLFDMVVMIADEASLVGALERMEAELVVLDLSLTSGNGLRLVCRLRQRFPAVKLVAIGVHSAQDARDATLAAGVDAFVTKSALPNDLVAAVETILAGATAGLDCGAPPPGAVEGGASHARP